MSKISGDDPAFPNKHNFAPFCGMSLRDWLAGMALSGFADRTVAADRLAQSAYEIADAMLAARGVRK